MTGVDISEAMLAEARKKVVLLPETSITLECGDVFALRFASGEFDVTVVTPLFH